MSENPQLNEQASASEPSPMVPPPGSTELAGSPEPADSRETAESREAAESTESVGSTEPADSTELADSTEPARASKRTPLPKGAWNGIIRRTVKGFGQDNLSDSAAALTYYAVLSIFPGLLVMVAALGVFGASTSNAVVKNIVALAPGQVGTTINSAVDTIGKGSHGTATLLAVVSILGSLWSASGYVGAFMRAANNIYDVPEGRPFWKLIPVRLVLTVLTGVVLAAAALSVLLTGELAKAVGSAVGIGDSAVNIWNIAKWPVLLIIVSLLFAMLYWASPNARVGRFRFFSAGSLLAVLIWIIASLGFAYYVANLSSYNRVYGSLATVIVFLIWLWVSNLALLFGAELDSEIRRERAIATGTPPDVEPYLALRDARKVPKPAPSVT